MGEVQQLFVGNCWAIGLEGKTWSQALLGLHPSSRLKLWGCFLISVSSLMMWGRLIQMFAVTSLCSSRRRVWSPRSVRLLLIAGSPDSYSLGVRKFWWYSGPFGRYTPYHRRLVFSKHPIFASGVVCPWCIWRWDAFFKLFLDYMRASFRNLEMTLVVPWMHDRYAVWSSFVLCLLADLALIALLMPFKV
jgi:hypothetical protein